MNNKRISGTREWAEVNVNCVKGCSNLCKYCYARYNAVEKFAYLTSEQWANPQINWKAVDKKHPKYNGVVMIPTTHDIFPETIDACITVLNNLLKVGNSVLIVSKPHLSCIKKICTELDQYKENILFRFTIGAMNDSILSYWEPNAPNFQERFDSLVYAFENGFKTSVSSEPMLDATGIFYLVDVLLPFITDAIWIGKMNNIRDRVKIETKEDEMYIKAIEIGQENEKIKSMYEILKFTPKIKWKESIKEVVGLELANEAGLDI